MSEPPVDLTDLLAQWNRGDRAAAAKLLSLTYQDLCRLAGAILRGERLGRWLDPQDLVHDAFLRLDARRGRPLRDRAHFLAHAAVTMRHLLVDQARRRGSRKRGGEVNAGPRAADAVWLPGRDGALGMAETLALHEALARLSLRHPLQARVVALRFGADLSIDETAALLGLSEVTVRRSWKRARAWLRDELRITPSSLTAGACLLRFRDEGSGGPGSRGGRFRPPRPSRPSAEPNGATPPRAVRYSEQENTMKHQSPAVRRSTLALVALVTLLACTAASAQNRLVSTNPHEPNLRSGSTPPMSYLASMTDSSATAYHVSSGTEVTRALAYNTYGKPKIISDDSGAATPTNAIAWINQVCAAGQHYEHYDLALGSSAYGYRATNGQLIDRLNDFPSPSRQVLAHIRDNSCASNLAAYGTLSVVNGQFRWNGQPVQLVGHSWMGALAGKNFDIVGNPAQGIPGYLGVLEDHRVNLTRVWVIEQWTGLLVNKPGFPHQSNVELPFTGSIDFSGSNDTLNLFAIDAAFLNRLRLFVDTAWAKGIVVQITLFDRHGLLNNAGEYGRWLGSPYNVNNNADSVLLAAGAAGRAPSSFPTICGTLPCGIGESHRLLIEAIVQELDGRGNVIFEIMNEPLSTEWNELVFAKWNSWVAKTVKNAP